MHAPLTFANGKLTAPSNYSVLAGQDANGNPVLLTINSGGGIGAGVRRTPAVDVVTTSGTFAEGAKSVALAISTDFSGTILGAPFSGATQGGLDYTTDGADTIDAIPYTISAGSIYIISLR